jgi:hypothetical protein
MSNIKMIEGWQEKIDAAQLETHFHANGVAFARIPYASESYDLQGEGYDDYPHCGDCGVAIGQLHVAGCDWEQCPKCHGQLLSCGCKFDEDEEVTV